METEKPILNPSSLLDLKAELHKKYESFRKAKQSQKSEAPRQTALKHKGQEEIPIKEKKVLKHTLKTKSEDNEEELALKKSREALESKAKFYEKITSNQILIDDEESEKYLVDFQRKVLYDNHRPDRAKSTDNSSEKQEESDQDIHSSELPKNDCYKSEASGVQNDKIPEKGNPSEESVHYENIRFNEVRDHGTAYFAFSTDESIRKQQMEELKKYRLGTEKKIQAHQMFQRRRMAILQARLAKVCHRRNIDKSVVQTYTKTQGSEEPSQVQEVDLSSIPVPETPEVPAKKEVKVRPWDVGKNDLSSFVPEKSKPRSQNSWIEERRSERPTDFAPPSSY